MMKKVRTILTTDMEVDDMNSLIHLCLYLNEMDVLGVVYTSSQYHFNGDGVHTLGEITPHYRTSGPAGLERPRTSYGPDPNGKDLKSFRPFPVGWIEELWKGPYAKAYPYLVQHDSSYPTPEHLLEITKYGNIEFEGDVRFDTEGSNLIKDYLLDENDDPIYLQSWGGINTIVRALLSIYEEYHDTEKWDAVYHKVVSKARILGVNKLVGQDNSYLDNKIPELYPDLVLLHPEHMYGVYYASIAAQKDVRSMFQSKWMLENIHNHTSDLMDAYRLYGDGKRVEGEAELYQFGITSTLDFGFPGTKPVHFDAYDFIGEGDSNTYIPLISFGLRGMEDYNYPTLLGKLYTEENEKKKGNVLTGENIPFNPFIKAYQEDFAARADWCHLNYDEASHAPKVTLKESDIYAKAGEVVKLSADVTETNNTYSVIWEHFSNYSKYEGQETVRPFEPWLLNTSVCVPSDAKEGDYFSLILRVQNKAKKPMTSFAQVVIHVING